MNLKFKAYIIASLAVLLIISILLIFFWIKKNNNINDTSNQKYYGYSLEKSTEVVIINMTKYNINNLMKVIICDVLKYDTLSVLITIMPEEMRSTEVLNYRAVMFKNQYMDNTYIIMLADNIKPSEMNEILLHEAAHIMQYQKEELIVHDFINSIYIYKGDTVDLKKISYQNREFEKDAYQIQEELHLKLNALIYD